MKLRKQIDDKYKWDIGMFKSEEEINSAFADLEFLTNELPKFSFYENKWVSQKNRK